MGKVIYYFTKIIFLQCTVTTINIKALKPKDIRMRQYKQYAPTIFLQQINLTMLPAVMIVAAKFWLVIFSWAK